MNKSAKGRRYEYKARDILESTGFNVIRSAASKGPIDLVAYDRWLIRFIQVKSTTKFTTFEIDRLKNLQTPFNSTKEIWGGKKTGFKIKVIDKPEWVKGVKDNDYVKKQKVLDGNDWKRYLYDNWSIK